MVRYVRGGLGFILVLFGLVTLGFMLAVAAENQHYRYFFGTLDGLRSFFGMLMLPLMPGLCGYLLLRPPRALLGRMVQAYRAAAAQPRLDRSRPLPAREKRGVLGQAISLGGTVLLVYSLFMDTSVDTGYGRVLNIGLLADRQNYLILGCFAIFIGVLLTLFRRTR
jgi:hypothetical protein